MKEDINVWENNAPVKENKAVPAPPKPKANYIDIDIKRILSVWPWVILFGLLGFMEGKLYMRYVTKIYWVSTTITIQSTEQLSIGQAVFGSNRDPYNDQIAYFKSPNFALMLVDSLGLQYKAIAKGRFKDKEMYSDLKWWIIPGDNINDVPKLNFTIIPDKTTFTYTAYGVKGTVKWNEPFMIQGHKVFVKKLDDISSKTPINLYNKDRIVEAFSLSKGIVIIPASESNVVTIGYSDVSSDRALDVLNYLSKLYNGLLLNDKALSYSQSIDFINKRLGPLAQELDSIEESLAHYKSSQGFIGTTANGEIYLDKIKEIDANRQQIDDYKSAILNIEQVIKDPTTKDETLSFMGIPDEYLQNTLMQYRQLFIQKGEILRVDQPTTDRYKLIEKAIADTKENMLIQLATYKKNLLSAQARNTAQMNDAQGLLKNTPYQEKVLLDKFRMQNLKEAIYLTLLQKREEAMIARAALTVDMKVLTPPVRFNIPEKPEGNKILLSAILIGLLLPLAFAIVKELINKKLISKKQLLVMTNIPVLAEIEETEIATGHQFVIEQNERSMIGEQMRTLRTNLNFYLSNKKTACIMLTSSMSGEGKSFLSINLARTYSLQGKRVALLEFDLRRPKISKSFGIAKDTPGLSSVLMDKAKPEDIFFRPPQIEENEVLHFYPSGIIPPNPQELISSQNMLKLKKYMDDNYDVIIIDTPPFGIVADAQILGELADVTLVITRFLLTMVDQIQELNEWDQRGVFKRMALIFNGVKNQGYYGSKYGYYQYKRKYGYSYYTNDANPKSGSRYSPYLSRKK